jgi:hypothetical protein
MLVVDVAIDFRWYTLVVQKRRAIPAVISRHFSGFLCLERKVAGAKAQEKNPKTFRINPIHSISLRKFHDSYDYYLRGEGLGSLGETGVNGDV